MSSQERFGQKDTEVMQALQDFMHACQMVPQLIMQVMHAHVWVLVMGCGMHVYEFSSWGAACTCMSSQHA